MRGRIAPAADGTAPKKKAANLGNKSSIDRYKTMTSSKHLILAGRLVIHMETQSIFEELCLPHLDAAYNLARWLVGRDQDAQDVVQEAYVRALKGFKGFRGDNARAWLLAIVRNAAYSWLKKRAKQFYMVPFDPAIHDRATGERLSESSREERVQQLDEALNRLPFEMREILVLRELEGWSYKQLASILKVPSGTIMSRLNRARQRLQRELAELRQMELKDEL
jgi:RNA polymerase sigma-70 factor, ECF subfamily